MAFGLLYNGADAGTIRDCYQASRTALAVADRQNIDGCWTAGLSAWDTAPLAYTVGTNSWVSYCQNPDGSPNLGRCDKLTRVIPIIGTWARNAASYGAVAGAVITLAGFVGLMKRMAAVDPDQVRGRWMLGLADDMLSNGGIEPYP